MNTEAIMSRVRNRQTISYHGADPSLRQIAATLGIPPSTFTRLQAGKNLSADALLKILVWLQKTRPEDMETMVLEVAGIKYHKNGKERK